MDFKTVGKVLDPSGFIHLFLFFVKRKEKQKKKKPKGHFLNKSCQLQVFFYCYFSNRSVILDRRIHRVSVLTSDVSSSWRISEAAFLPLEDFDL